MAILDFDKGTILIRDLPEKDLLRIFPNGEFVFDARVNCYRTFASQYFSILFKLYKDNVPVCNQIFKKINDFNIAPKLPQLRPYQFEAIQHWKSSNNRGIVCLPTGAGKTIVAAAAIEALNTTALCIVPTKVLMEQWQKKFQEFFGCEIGQYGDGNRQKKNITIATFSSAYHHMKEIGNDFKLLIVDEVHHFGNGLRDELLLMAAAPWRLGLTATPPEKGELTSLENQLIGPLCFSLSLNDLKGVYLSSYHLMKLKIELLPHEREVYEAEYKRFYDFYSMYKNINGRKNWNHFVAKCNRSDQGKKAMISWYRMRKIVAFPIGKRKQLEALLKKHWNNRILIFASSTSVALEISKKFFIPPITGEITRSERESILDYFRQGKIRSIVSCKVLNEGYDLPDADIAIILGGSSKPREFIQRVGRVLRKSEGKVAIIYELFAGSTYEEKHSNYRNLKLVG